MTTEFDRGRSNRELFGFVIILVGIGLLLNTMGILPALPFWPVIRQFWFPAMFIGIGALLLSRRGHEGLPGALFFLLFGVFILLGNLNYWGFEQKRWIGPAILIWIGLTFLTRRAGPQLRDRPDRPRRQGPNSFQSAPNVDDADFTHASVVFGGFNRRCTSQQYRGGNMTAIMGGGKLDLRDAVIRDGEAVLDLFVLMGGIEVQVPTNWVIEPQYTPILGGYEDQTNQTQGTQRLIIRGTTMLGGIKIHN